MSEPTSPGDYATALSRLTDGIEQVRNNVGPAGWDAGTDAKDVVTAINGLTRAALLIADGMLLLATPPKVDTVATPGTFGVLGDDDESAIEDDSDPRETP